MGKKRSKTPDNLPPRVYLNTARYYHEAKGTRKTTALCERNAPIENVWRSYQSLVLDAQDKIDPSVATLWNLAQKWLKTDGLQNARGKPLDGDSIKKIQNIFGNKESQLMKKFGDQDPDAIKTSDLRKYMDSRYRISPKGKIVLDDYDKPIVAKNQANKERTYLIQLYAWGKERDWCGNNPAESLSPFPKETRSRYITDAEFKEIHKHAEPYVRSMMELSFFCAMRFADVAKLTYADIAEEGLLCGDSKIANRPGNKRPVMNLRLWSQALRKAVERAKNLPVNLNAQKIVSINQVKWLVTKPNGKQITYDGFRKDWTHARRKAGLLHDINHKNHLDFHDIKKKSITDFEAGNDDERLLYSAHKSKQQMNDYNLKINPDRRPAGNHDLGLD